MSRSGSTVGYRRRILVMGVAAGLLASACGSSGTTASSNTAGAGTSNTLVPLSPCPLDALASATKPVEVVVWHPFAAKTKDTLDAMVAQYNASQSKVKVRVEAQGSYDELAAKYQAGAANKDLPAIAILEDVRTKSIADSGTVLAAQSCINADHYDMSGFVATVKAFYSVGGALFPASANVSTPLLYLNRAQFRKAGLDPDKPPTTLAELRTAAAKLKAAGVVDKPLALSLQPWFIESWLTGEGAPIVDNANGRGPAKTTRAVLDNPQTVQLYTWIRDMYRDGLLTAIPNTTGNIDDYLAMAQQKTSMIIESSTAATSIKAFLKGNLDPASLQGGGGAPPVDPNALDIGAAALPGVNQPGKVRLGGSGWYITNTTKPEVQAAAWEFMKWWNQNDQQVRWNLEGSYLPFLTSAAKDPRVISNWTSDLSGRWLAISYGQLVNGVNPGFPGAQFGPLDKYTSATTKSIESMIFGSTSPSAAVGTAAAQTTDAITQYNKQNF